MNNDLEKQAWEELDKSVVTYRGEPVGTVAARDPNVEALNYDQVFTRDFAVSAVTYLLYDRPAIVKNFLVRTLELQSRDKHMDCFRPGQGLMPVSFKVEVSEGEERLEADFGEKAIARVAPVDAPLWWLFVLRTYTRATGDHELARRPEFQHGIRLILDLALTTRFDMFPTLLVPDGSFMVDRRMGVYGHPLDVQALFFTALQCALEVLEPGNENAPYIHGAQERLGHLLHHIRNYYWLDRKGLTALRHAKVEDYGESAVNRFNIYSESIPEWVDGWIPEDGGYFAGNLGPARLDTRFFTAGNLMAVLFSLASTGQAEAILNLVRARWDDLLGDMPVKACYPALEGEAWKLVTGCDPKNTAWSYQNGGGWPFLLWLLAGAALKAGRAELAADALAVAEERVAADRWPEYYDGPDSRHVGKEARLYQTWSCAGYLAAHKLVAEPERLRLLELDENPEVAACSLRASETYAKLIPKPLGS
jgi:hypothetical protein